MHSEHIEHWQHQHTFNPDKTGAERRTLVVVLITLSMMGVEIVAGWLTQSMALFADGWHMGTHAFALGVSLLAFILARRYSRDVRFGFGTWKIEILGAYTSAVILGIVGLLMAWASVERLLAPVPIDYEQATVVAAIGLAVNVACAFILGYRGGHRHTTHGLHAVDAQSADPEQHLKKHHHPHADHKHHIGRAHGHHTSGSRAAGHPGHAHDDLNLRSAYLHVVADATTSVLAIAALLGVRHLGLTWLDPLMGLVGAGLILRWSYLLLKDTSGVLLDLTHQTSAGLLAHVKAHIESDGESKVSDLHLWKVAQDRYACILALVTGAGRTTEEYKARLQRHSELAHLTVEINRCRVEA